MLAINTISAITEPLQSSSPSTNRARSTSPAERQLRRKQGNCVRCGSREHWVKDCDIQPYKDTGKLVPPPGLKVMVGENGRRVMICPVDYDSDSELSIGPYSPNSNYGLDSDAEELAYQELVETMDRERRK